MCRKMEQRLVLIMGIWQIIDGLITIIFYGLGNQLNLFGFNSGNVTYLKQLDATYGNIFLFVSSFGVVLIGLGLVNILLSKKYIKDDQIHFRMGMYIMIQSLLSYFILDFISLILGMTAGVLLIAKNKSIRLKKKLA
ncbi:hypothetical protein [Enterococcus sp. RIT-PI-f]|uniref:hypothetical protein n=1 Tax=Enterococcus sp. RIT-PI-f TaxID=1690244 RepID=UPI0006B991DD|nr:hypothetical protein [Enterococcus sp. RIT-PI-f]KPG71339.1 hypothetical protein AEQ18_03975 [Enterococcus sp. RIT-PI-f]